jgi:hypothetical protein
LAGTKHPRLQILTIEDLLNGKRIDMPTQQESAASGKRRRRRGSGRTRRGCSENVLRSRRSSVAWAARPCLCLGGKGISWAAVLILLRPKSGQPAAAYTTDPSFLRQEAGEWKLPLDDREFRSGARATFGKWAEANRVK